MQRCSNAASQSAFTAREIYIVHFDLKGNNKLEVHSFEVILHFLVARDVSYMTTMQSLQHAQRLLSSSGCSTSGSSAQPHASSCSSLQQRTDIVTVRSHSCRLHVQGHRSSSTFRHVKLSLRRRKSKYRSPSHAIPVTADVNTPLQTESLIITKYVAETCLPTRTGKYRVRAYRHSVDITSLLASRQAWRTSVWHIDPTQKVMLQVDGGRSFSEPTCIMTGKPEGKENVSHAMTHVIRFARACECGACTLKHAVRLAGGGTCSRCLFHLRYSMSLYHTLS